MARRTSALFASVDLISIAMTDAPLSGPGRRRDDAELLQQTQLVPTGPVLGPLPRRVEAGDDHHSHVYPLPGCRDAEQGSMVRALQGKPAGHAVTFRDHLFHRTLQIGQTLAQCADEHLQPLQCRREVRPYRVGDVVGRVQLVGQVDVAPAAALVEPATVRRRVVFRCHWQFLPVCAVCRRYVPATGTEYGGLGAQTSPVRVIFWVRLFLRSCASPGASPDVRLPVRQPGTKPPTR